MSQLQHKPMTPAEFLAWEAKQELKWEFDGFQPVAMTGVTDAHAAIQSNLLTALNVRLRGRRCYSRGSEIKVEIGPKYRYPGAFVSCTRVAPNATIAADPVVIFEILSESTAKTDRTTKLIEYQSLPSVQRYVLLEQDQALVTVITRGDTEWTIKMLDANEILSMPEIDVEVPMAELYEGLEFTPLDL